jgi:hypothetical protein
MKIIKILCDFCLEEVEGQQVEASYRIGYGRLKLDACTQHNGKYKNIKFDKWTEIFTRVVKTINYK